LELAARDVTMQAVISLLLVAMATVAQGKEHLRIGTVPLEPWVISTEVSGSSKVKLSGYIPDLLNRLGDMLDFNYTLEVRGDQLFGHADDTGDNSNWTGLIGDVVHKRVDMAAAAVTETAERRDVTDFSTPFMSFGSVAILKKQQTVLISLTERLERIFMPCSRGVWLTLALAWLITSAVLYVVCHVNPYEWRRLCHDKQATMREGEMSSCPNIFWFTVSTLLLQGFTRAPRSLGGRIITIFWWHYVILFVIMYISSMTNYYLRVQPIQEDNSFSKLRMVSELADQSEIKYGVLTNSASLSKLKNSKSDSMQKVYDGIGRYEDTVQSGIERVRKSSLPYAFITESAMAMYYAKQLPCDVYMVSDYMSTGSYSLVLPLKSPRLHSLDVALLKLRQNGDLSQLYNKWFVGQCTSFLLESNQQDELKLPAFYPVDLTTMSGALIILIGGLILGSVATVVEVFIYKQAEKGEKDEKQKLQQTQDGAHDQDGGEPITDV